MGKRDRPADPEQGPWASSAGDPAAGREVPCWRPDSQFAVGATGRSPLHVDEWLVDYVDGEASPAICDEVEAHVAQCEQCAVELHLLERSNQLLTDAFAPDRLPDALRESLAAAIASEPVGDGAQQGEPSEVQPDTALRRSLGPWGGLQPVLARPGAPHPNPLPQGEGRVRALTWEAAGAAWRTGGRRWVWASICAAAGLALIFVGLQQLHLSAPSASTRGWEVVRQYGPAPLVAYGNEQPSAGSWLDLPSTFLPRDTAVRTTRGSRLAVRLANGSNWQLNEESLVRFCEALGTVRIECGEVFARLAGAGSRVVLPRAEVRTDGSELLISVTEASSLIHVYNGAARLRAADGPKGDTHSAVAIQGESISLGPSGPPTVQDAPAAQPPSWVEDLGDRQIMEDEWLPAFQPAQRPVAGGKADFPANIDAIRLAVHPTYQRMVFDFAEGALSANGVPNFRVQWRPYPARVIVSLSNVLNFLAKPLPEPQGLVLATYHVEGPRDYEHHVHLYLRSQVKLRVLSLDAPGRLVVDMRSDGPKELAWREEVAPRADSAPRYAVYVLPLCQEPRAIQRLLRALSGVGAPGDVVIASDGKTQFVQTGLFASHTDAAARCEELRRLNFTAQPALQLMADPPDANLFSDVITTEGTSQ